MSKRHNPGDCVWLKPNSGFVGESHRHKAQIIGEVEDTDRCCLECGDPECREWPNLFAEIDGKCHNLCHVCECQMLDGKYEAPK